MQRQRRGIHPPGSLQFPIRDMGEERWEECLNDILVHPRSLAVHRSWDFFLHLVNICSRLLLLKTAFSTRSDSGEFINEWF